MEKPSEDQIERMLLQHGRRGSETLDNLGRLTPFIEVFNTDIGKLLLKDDLEDFQRLLLLIIDEKETGNDRAEFRVIKRRIKKNAERIVAYRGELEKIKKS